MSDKAVGIIGQKYEDRKTGKSGILESRDDKYKTLLFRADDGSTFNISNSSFRSNWRKVKEEDVATEEATEEVVEETVVEESTEDATEDTVEEDTVSEEKKPKKSRKSEKKVSQPTMRKDYSDVSLQDAIATFVNEIMPVRKVGIANEGDVVSVFVDDITVMRITDNGNDTLNLAMLPDVFTLTDWRGILKTSSIQYKMGAEGYLGITVDTKESCIPEILDITTEVMKDINLYGYTVEDEEGEDTNDGEN